MPVPQQLGRSDRMGRGPYEKSGMIEDTGLPPGKPVYERFDIMFPTDDVEVGDKIVRKTLAYDLDVDVKLWYRPFGTTNEQFLWHEYKKRISISKEGK